MPPIHTSPYGLFRQRLADRRYRIKLAFFLILGTSSLLVSALLRETKPFLSDVVLQFATVFAAVGLVQVLWDFLGGDLMEDRLLEIRSELTHLRDARDLLADLLKSNLGLERAWPSRRDWVPDPQDGLFVWKDRLCSARTADLMGTSLWTNWVTDHSLMERFFGHLASGADVRILLYDPDSALIRQREADECDEDGNIRGEARATLRRIAQYRTGLAESQRIGLRVRLTATIHHRAQLVRADGRMLIALYLARKSGGASPTLQLRGLGTEYFRIYHGEFEAAWQVAQEVTDAKWSVLSQRAGPTTPDTQP